MKRGADARTVGGDAYAAALNGEVRVFCFPTVACCVVGEERGAQIALEHNVQRNGFSCFLVVAVIGGFLVRIGLFDPCGGDRLTVVDCVSRSEREAAAGSGFLGPGFTEDVVCAGFVADGDGVAIRDGERDRAVACGGFRDGDSGEHVGEDKCRFVVGVSVHDVHGACFLFCVGVRFYCSTQARVLSTRVRGWSRHVAAHVGPPQLLFDWGAFLCWRILRLCWLDTRLLRTGAFTFGFDVRAIGVNGYLSACDREVWVFWLARVFGFVNREACGAQVTVVHHPQLNSLCCFARRFIVLVVVGGRLACLVLFDPCGSDYLSGFGRLLYPRQDSPANVFALLPAISARRDAYSFDFVSDGDGVTVREGDVDCSAIERVVLDSGSREHVGECLCCLIVVISAHGASCFFLWRGGCFGS